MADVEAFDAGNRHGQRQRLLQGLQLRASCVACICTARPDGHAAH
jgi:hypothetical protein